MLTLVKRETGSVAALGPARMRRSRHGAILLPFRVLASAMKDAAG